MIHFKSYTPVSWHLGFGKWSLLPCFTTRTKSLPVLPPSALVKVSAVSLSNYSLLTGLCVGAGTIAFFLLFQKGGPLSAVPAILAGGAAIMALAGILFFGEAPSWQRIAGLAFAIIGCFLLRR